MGHDVMLAPMLHIESIANADLGPLPCAAILLTSANGARALAAHPRLSELKPLPVLAVGQTSADAARAAGFTDVTSADGDAVDLARLAATRFPQSRIPLLHVAGLDRSGDLAGSLSSQGIAVRIAVAYRAAAATQFPPDTRDALTRGTIDAVLHFSRRSVDAYLDMQPRSPSRRRRARSLLPVVARRRTAAARRRNAHPHRRAPRRSKPARADHLAIQAVSSLPGGEGRRRASARRPGGESSAARSSPTPLAALGPSSRGG